MYNKLLHGKQIDEINSIIKEVMDKNDSANYKFMWIDRRSMIHILIELARSQLKENE